MIRVGVNLLILFLENFAMQKLYIKFPNLGWGAVANILAENKPTFLGNIVIFDFTRLQNWTI